MISHQTPDDEGWVIVKGVREYKGGLGYCGPTWEKITAPMPEKPYKLFAIAQSIADELADWNAVGFRVEKYRPRES